MALEAWTCTSRTAGGGEVSIGDAHFSFITADTVRKLSVCQVTSGMAFNSMGQPHPGGPHDLRLGEFRYEGAPRGAKCPTCNLARDCPGHVGHIELPTTCYNPLIFLEMNKLIKAYCQSCHHLKISRDTAQRYIWRFALLERGFARESQMLKIENFAGARGRKTNAWMQEMDSHESCTWNIQNASDQKGDNQIEDFELTVDKQSEFANAIHSALETTRDNVHEKLIELIAQHEPIPSADAHTSYMELWHELCAEVMEDTHCKSCENCGSKNHTFRKDGYTKMFLKRQDGEVFIDACQIRDMLRKLWEKDGDILRYLYPGSKTTGADMYFVDVMAVTPNRLRPMSAGTGGGGESPHDQTKLYAAILETCRKLVEATASEEMLEEKRRKEGTKVETIKLDKDGNQIAQKPAYQPEIGTLVCELQEHVNGLIDSSKGKKTAGKFDTTGVRQKLEKKQGLFRMNMMGKRVNYAARSVISPDNNLAPNEIGIPKAMAMRLTFPEPVNARNLQIMQRLVLNGPDQYPGATAILDQGRVEEKPHREIFNFYVF